MFLEGKFVVQCNSEESSLVATFNSGAVNGLAYCVSVMYFLFGQTNDLRFVRGEDDAPFCTLVCDCLVEDL